jgi:hypothetical protein
MTCRVLSQQRSAAVVGSEPLTHASRLLICEASVAGLKRAQDAIERSKLDFFEWTIGWQGGARDRGLARDRRGHRKTACKRWRGRIDNLFEFE